MSDYALSLKRTGILLAAVAFIGALFATNFLSVFGGKVGAVQLTSRSLSVTSTLPGDEVGTGVAGDETNGSEVGYTFTFTPSTTSIGGVIFKACTTAIGACTAPTMAGGGQMHDNTTFTSTTLDDGAGTWVIDNTGLTAEDAECTGTNGLNNCIAIGLAAASVQAGTSVNVIFANVENPETAGTFFVRIQTYDDNAFTTDVDDGTVASAVTEGVYITSRVAETLGFSTTGAFALAAGGSGVDNPTSDCDPLTGSGAIGLGDPTETTLSITQAYDNYSAFRVYTNAATGVNIYYDGETLTKGTDTITAVGTEVLSDFGTEQFGLAIDESAGGNTTLAPTSRATTVDAQYVSTAAQLDGGAGEISTATDYDEGAGDIQEGPSVAEFSFAADTPTLLASSTGYVLCNTAAVRYLANIAPTTEAGTYTTTIVYLAVPTY